MGLHMALVPIWSAHLSHFNDSPTNIPRLQRSHYETGHESDPEGEEHSDNMSARFVCVESAKEEWHDVDTRVRGLYRPLLTYVPTLLYCCLVQSTLHFPIMVSAL